jgi:hypothetical protein
VGERDAGGDKPQADALEVLIDRVAEAVVQKLEERRKIDLIAEAVLQRIRVQSAYRAPEETQAPEVSEEADHAERGEP